MVQERIRHPEASKGRDGAHEISVPTVDSGGSTNVRTLFENDVNHKHPETLMTDEHFVSNSLLENQNTK